MSRPVWYGRYDLLGNSSEVMKSKEKNLVHNHEDTILFKIRKLDSSIAVN